MIEDLKNADQKLIEGWPKQCGRPVSLSEVQQINRNLSRFFSIMLSWEKQFQKEGLIDEAGNIRNPNNTD